jgi:hypothetical protein
MKKTSSHTWPLYLHVKPEFLSRCTNLSLRFLSFLIQKRTNFSHTMCVSLKPYSQGTITKVILEIDYHFNWPHCQILLEKGFLRA